MILALLACGPVLEIDGWRGVDSDLWGGGVACEPVVEEQGIELSTERCPSATVAQTAVRDGVIEGGVLWDTLYADVPAEGVLGVAVAGQVVWEERVQIPQGRGDVQFSGISVEAGQEVLLHVHNHGLNTYLWVLAE